MKKRIFAILLCAAMLISLCGCSQEAPETTTPPTTLPPETEPPVEAAYVQAADMLNNAQNLEMDIEITKSFDIGPETFTLQSTQEVLYAGLGTDDLQIKLEEDLDLNGLEDYFDEYFSKDMLYTTVYGDYHFKGAISQEEYLSRQVPGVMLDPALYSEISAQPEGSGTRLSFDAPTTAESWALPDGAEMVSATGAALVDSDGQLEEASYSLTYTQGGYTISLEVSAEMKIPESVALTPPEDESIYAAIESIDAPRLYDTAMLYLYSSGRAHTMINETMVSQAAGVLRQTQTNVDFFVTEGDLISKVQSDIMVYQQNQSSTAHEEHLYRDNTYTYTLDNAAPQVSTEITPDQMLSFCMDYMGENAISPEYFDAAKVTAVGGIPYLEITLNEEYAELLIDYTCSNLFDDPDLLRNLATAYETTENTAYLSLDPVTGMPIALGIQYGGTHTIEGSPCALQLQTSQSFNISSDAPYKTITGEVLPEEEPATPAAPLFYEVTGENGQHMYLFGTIHIGDNRTAYLPQEIYDALEASDALAVEFDAIAFEEAISADPTLAAQISALYYHTDGTSARDHMDAELYESAVKMLKASGNYNTNTKVMKTSLWYQTISNFYTSLTRNLQSDKGVDMRLLRLAKEKNIPIRDIESGIFQFEMLVGFSEELQNFILEDTLSADAAESAAASVDLFDMWCAGDEAALREELVEDSSEYTEEELALFKEFEQAMYIDRNAHMLSVAMDYLESGETVFYAVGLGHLLAYDGLVDTLQEAGYTVTPVAYN